MEFSGSKALMTDYYELTMCQGYFNSGMINQQATFELFFRSNPFSGGYAIVAGIEEAIEFLLNYKFDQSDIDYLKQQNQFSDEFLRYLVDLEFDGAVEGLPEGSVAFPHEPLLQITGSLGLLQLVESALLNIINYSTLIATKAARIVYSAKKYDTILEFGLRRAQGDGAIVGSRAAIIGGCAATSNTLAGKLYGLPVAGTQAHSWVQSFNSEIDAFRAYADTFPNNTVLLVDTYDTLKSGVPNAIKIAKEMEEGGRKLRGIRIDSGDLAWLALESAKMLDDAGLDDVKIILSSDLDEYVIESIVNQIALTLGQRDDLDFRQRLLDRILWGVGTHLITGSGNEKAALGGVYKLVEISGKPVIKISENRAKTTNPSRKKLWRIKSESGEWIADVLSLYNERAPKKGDKIYHHSDATKQITLGEILADPLHIDLIDFYKSKMPNSWQNAKERCRLQLFGELDESHLRFLNPHIYKVSLSQKLFDLKQSFFKDDS